MGRDGKGHGAAGRPTSPGYRADVLDVLDRLLANRRDVTRGKMFGFPAFYTAGKLFACVYGDGIGLKLPQGVIRQLDGRPGITSFQPYGKPKMKEWIQIRHDRTEAYAKDARLFQASIRFVGQMAKRSGTSGLTQRPRKRS
jgi:hypothetical protein